MIYSKDVQVTVELETQASDGSLKPQFEHLIWDSTKFNITIPPTLTIVNNQLSKTFVVMMRYKFDRNSIYTDSIIQELNCAIIANIHSNKVDASDTTDENYFKEYITIPFVTTRFKLRQKTTAPIQAQQYQEKEVIKIVPQFSKKSIFNLYSVHEYKMLDETVHGATSGSCNFTASHEAAKTIARKKEINFLTTVKGIPTTISIEGSQNFTVYDNQFTDTVAAKSGDDVRTWVSPTIGYVKQMNNFARDMM